MSSDTSAPPRGAFIAFEGGDGSGKSTQARLLAEAIDAVLTREPGGTPIGESIRAVVLDPAFDELSGRTEALLMAAARAQHVEEVIEPALRSGRHVVSDRFIASSLAYQGVGRGLGIDEVATMNQFATAGLAPDIVVLLDVRIDAARERLGDELDRIEASGTRLAAVVAATYRELAAAEPERWIVIPAEGPIDDIHTAILAAVSQRLAP